MIEIAAAAAVIKLVADSVGLVDKIYDSWRKYTENKTIEPSQKTEYYEKITSSPDKKAIVHLVDGLVNKQVTIDELKNNLSQFDKEHMEALEKRLKINVSVWNAIVANIELETNLVNKQKYEIQLEELKAKIGKDLAAILKFVESLGFILQDHYGAAKNIANNL